MGNIIWPSRFGGGGGGGGGGTDDYFDLVKLLLGMDGSNGGTTFTDESASPVTFSTNAGSPTTSTALKKFGTAALRCSSSSISTPGVAPKWDPGSGDFTIEMWVSHDSTNDGSSRGYIQWGTNPTLAISRLATGSGTWEFYARTLAGGAVSTTQSAGSQSVTADTFFHVAFDRNGSVLRGFIDGVMKTKATALSGALEAVGTLLVGTSANGNHLGYIDELRFSSMSRYGSVTGDTSFTPPTAAFPRSQTAPAFATGPSISGPGTVGQTLTASYTATIYATPTYQWKRDGSNIGGATSSTYTLQGADAGTTTTCAITLTNSAGNITTASSGIGPIAADPVRGHRIAWVNNAASVMFTLPTGSTAGDRCVIAAGHGFGVSTPAGWSSLDNQTGTFFNGGVFHKVLSSGDISTGSVTISFSGAYYGVVAGITFVGGMTGIRTTQATRNGTGASSRTVTTGSSPVSGDVVFYFGMCRGNVTATANVGIALDTTTNNEGSGVSKLGVLTAGGAISAIYSYTGSPSGDYQGIVVVQP